jgi:hypothetical protein
VERAVPTLVACIALACEAAEPGARVARPPGPDAAFAGLFEVTGDTTVRRSGQQRRIEGRVIIARSAEGVAEPYTATFDLETEFATPEGPIQADVIGSARAHPEPTGLTGTAETRILMASIPGLDPTFPWIPGRLGPRVLSKFTMTVGDAPDRFEIAIESEPAPGESYEPTRTRLRATRRASGPPPAAEGS